MLEELQVRSRYISAIGKNKNELLGNLSQYAILGDFGFKVIIVTEYYFHLTTFLIALKSYSFEF